MRDPDRDMELTRGWESISRPATSERLRSLQEHTDSLKEAGYEPRHCRRIKEDTIIRLGMTGAVRKGFRNQLYRVWIGEFIQPSQLIPEKESTNKNR